MPALTAATRARGLAALTPGYRACDACVCGGGGADSQFAFCGRSVAGKGRGSVSKLPALVCLPALLCESGKVMCGGAEVCAEVTKLLLEADARPTARTLACVAAAAGSWRCTGSLVALGTSLVTLAAVFLAAKLRK